MMEFDDKIYYAIEHTEVVRPPKQSLATFGVTNIYYYLITELMEKVSIVREGRVIAERPRIVTPYYLVNLEGFSESARRFVELMAQKFPNEPNLFYRYRNEPKEMNIASLPLREVVDKINTSIDNRQDPLSSIIKGVEEFWDVSLLKFIYELTRRSLYTNIQELEERGLFEVDQSGIPLDARRLIEELLEEARRDRTRVPELVMELRRWGLFAEYQDRFFQIFRRNG